MARAPPLRLNEFGQKWWLSWFIYLLYTKWGLPCQSLVQFFHYSFQWWLFAIPQTTRWIGNQAVDHSPHLEFETKNIWRSTTKGVLFPSPPCRGRDFDFEYDEWVETIHVPVAWSWKQWMGEGYAQGHSTRKIWGKGGSTMTMAGKKGLLWLPRSFNPQSQEET